MSEIQYRVEKQDYSVNPWRVLTVDGEQVWDWEVFDHPFLGKSTITGPVSFSRKRDALAWITAKTQGALL